MNGRTRRGANADKSSLDIRRLHFQERVGAQIRAARHQAGMSLRVLAEQTGLSTSTITHAEDGKGFSAFALTLIAGAIDVTLDDLVPLDATDLPTDEAAE